MATASRRPSPSRQTTLLVVDDDVRAQRLLRLNLEPLGYRLITVGEAHRVGDAVDVHQPDLILLELQLPGGDGFALCQQIRATSSVPIIIVSACGQQADKVRALALGADDYLTKPYDPAELAARIGAVLRRVQGQHLQGQSLFHCGPLTIDFEQRRVTLHGDEVSLSRTEYRLLEALAHNAGRVLVADTLLATVWGAEYMGDYASLHLYINRLRRKLGENGRNARLIRTKPGIGYMMPAAVDAAA